MDKFYADLAFLEDWAGHIMHTREPNFTIHHNGKDYLRRWWIVPRNHFQNIYLHEILEPDDARALHDHPWNNTSFILKGSYKEITGAGEFIREAGSITHRDAAYAHRLELIDNQPVISLFTTGPMIREWGFHCPNGWRRWRDFTALAADGKSSEIGRGCE